MQALTSGKGEGREERRSQAGCTFSQPCGGGKQGGEEKKQGKTKAGAEGGVGPCGEGMLEGSRARSRARGAAGSSLRHRGRKASGTLQIQLLPCPCPPSQAGIPAAACWQAQPRRVPSPPAFLGARGGGRVASAPGWGPRGIWPNCLQGTLPTPRSLSTAREDALVARHSAGTLGTGSRKVALWHLALGKGCRRWSRCTSACEDPVTAGRGCACPAGEAVAGPSLEELEASLRCDMALWARAEWQCWGDGWAARW